MPFFFSRKTIDLTRAFEDAVEETRKAMAHVARLDTEIAQDSLIRGTAKMRGSAMLSLRMAAAQASIIAGKLSHGKPRMRVPANKPLVHTLLGRHATHYRVYQRDLDKDLGISVLCRMPKIPAPTLAAYALAYTLACGFISQGLLKYVFATVSADCPKATPAALTCTWFRTPARP